MGNFWGNAVTIGKEHWMRKKGYKGRCRKKKLAKCRDVCRTYDDIQFAYADLLNEREDISQNPLTIFWKR